MTSTKAAMDELDQLNLFVTRTEELLNSRVIKSGFNSNFTISFAEDREIKFTSEEPDEEDLRSFLLTFRQFVSDGEPVHIYRIYNVCQKRITSDELKGYLAEGRAEWKRSLAQGGFKLAWSDTEFQPEEVLDLYINGSYFHNDIAKREFLDKIAPHQKMLLRHVFLGLLIDGIRQVQFVSGIIRNAIQDGSIRQ